MTTWRCCSSVDLICLSSSTYCCQIQVQALNMNCKANHMIFTQHKWVFSEKRVYFWFQQTIGLDKNGVRPTLRWNEMARMYPVFKSVILYDWYLMAVENSSNSSYWRALQIKLLRMQYLFLEFWQWYNLFCLIFCQLSFILMHFGPWHHQCIFQVHGRLLLFVLLSSP